MNITLIQPKCEICKEGTMVYRPGPSFDAFSDPRTFVLEDIDNIVDGIISEFLVYQCHKCGHTERLTYKEIERRERKRISQIVMNSAAKGEIEKSINLRKPKVFVYCGKCPGLDGKGACLKETYKECKIKHFPNEL
jgi:DNA-directed RNA polymerase subunit M/transcription elongation factor TFIIS